MPVFLEFRQRAAAYVLRRLPGRAEVEVLVMLHRDQPDAGVQVPGGGAHGHGHETIGEAAMREAREETGVEGLVFGEALGSKLMRVSDFAEEYQVTTYCWLRTEDPRDAWNHTVTSGDGDNGLRMHCEFRPAREAGIDWEMDGFLPHAVSRFASGTLPTAD
ncbi:NUDIX domain-containing protein [Glycomyces paridis]|uniref:NUDIX domain-containing protein n=1 Tax=Glycomyces paridis TaxID=2126555 RepID=A0A4V4HP28_9ACTN|nr:NUDIX domain-containing protein [Glycomyces paridis]THV28286.1 NUDIX domain-containing protein [Glycomyces paridis]